MDSAVRKRGYGSQKSLRTTGLFDVVFTECYIHVKHGGGMEVECLSRAGFLTRRLIVNVSGPLLTDLGGVAPPGHVLGPDGLLDAVHLLLVALAVAGGVLLGLLQSGLQGFDPLCCGAKTLLQFRKLTA